MYITTHACERYLERELGFITWTTDDIKRARKCLLSFICSHKHQNLCKKKDKIVHVLIEKLVLVFSKAKEVLITLYPMDQERVDYLNNKKHEPKRKKLIPTPKLEALKIKGRYPDPKLLSISITETKKKIHITINDDKNPFNLSGVFATIEKAQKFISDYTTFYNQR